MRSQSPESERSEWSPADARDGRVRRRAVEIYGRAAADFGHAPEVIASALRAARELHSSERRRVSEAVHALIRWKRRLGFALGDDAAPALLLYLAWLAGELGASVIEAELEAAGADPSRLQTTDERLAELSDPRLRLAIAASYPDWLVGLLADQYGLEESSRLLDALNRRAPLSARANRLKNTREALGEQLEREGVPSRPLELTRDGLELLTHVNAYGLEAFRQGRFELQDAGSQLTAELVAPPPGGLVVDACAGAGGKTLALGALLENRGRLVALDVSARRLDELRRRVRRAGLTNVRAVVVEAERPAATAARLALIGAADRVLVDAPCSGLGALRRKPEARWRLDARDLERLTALQAQLLDNYAALVRPRGRLIYATCTITRAENDDVVASFLARHPEFEPVPAKEILGSERAQQIGDGDRLRLLPHRHGSDGFFAAVLRRR